jgi:hypothetical protein
LDLRLRRRETGCWKGSLCDVSAWSGGEKARGLCTGI